MLDGPVSVWLTNTACDVQIVSKLLWFTICNSQYRLVHPLYWIWNNTSAVLTLRYNSQIGNLKSLYSKLFELKQLTQVCHWSHFEKEGYLQMRCTYLHNLDQLETKYNIRIIPVYDYSHSANWSVLLNNNSLLN